MQRFCVLLESRHFLYHTELEMQMPLGLLKTLPLSSGSRSPSGLCAISTHTDATLQGMIKTDMWKWFPTFLLMILTAQVWPVPFCSHLYTVEVAPLQKMRSCVNTNTKASDMNHP